MAEDSESEKKIVDSRLADKDIEWLKSQIKNKELKDVTVDPVTDPLPKSRRTIELEKLKAENEQLKETQRQALLKQFTEEDQKEYKDYSANQLQLVLDIQQKYKPKGIRRTVEADTKTTVAAKRLDAGSIGKYNYQTQQWE